MRKVSTLVGLAVLILAGSARAQDEGEAAAAAPGGEAAAAPAADAAAAPAPAAEGEAAPAPAPMAAGDDYVSRGLTVAEGSLQVTVPIVLNLSKNAVLKPVWVPLDLRFGVSSQLEVFLAHSLNGTPLAFGQGGVCLGGTDRGCAKFYNNLTVGAQYSLSKSDGIELSGIGALDVRSLDPMWLAVDLGVGFKYVAAPIAIKAAPQIGIAATKRSEQNYKEFLSVPVQVAFQANPQLAIFLDTGIFSPISKFGDSYVVPLGVGAAFAAMPNLDVGGELMLPALLAPSAVPSDFKGVNQRNLMLFASYRTK